MDRTVSQILCLQATILTFLLCLIQKRDILPGGHIAPNPNDKRQYKLVQGSVSLPEPLQSQLPSDQYHV